MRHFEDGKQIVITISRFFLLGIGIGFMIFIVSFDFFRPGPSHFGIEQFSTFVVSAIVALAGLRKLALSRARLWDGMLLLIYLAGILFMGLKSGGHNFHGSNGLLGVSWPPMKDFVINILGFFPLSYLMMLFFLSDNRIDKLVIVAGVVLASGICISLLIELLQYYIPGRSSSLFDIIANGIGTFIGVSYYLFEKKIFIYDGETN
jgi:hypothetical protein